MTLKQIRRRLSLYLLTTPTLSLLVGAVVLVSIGVTISLAIHSFTHDDLTITSRTVDNPDYETKPAPPPPAPYTFPGGSQTLVDKYRLVALYGSLESAGLGALGQQPLDETIARVKQIASEYQPFSDLPIYPTFEIITTTASAGPGSDGSYSRKSAIDPIMDWIRAAQENDIYVLLDLQPGRDSFADQAKLYEQALLEPNVGLALDPEWRLTATQLPLRQIGKVDADEINQTSLWLSNLISENDLPQKLFLIHQFQLASLPDRQLIADRQNLWTIIQMDGQGSQGAKRETYRAIIQTNPPTHIRFGWKNFYKMDHTTLTPEQTMSLDPVPWYVSYQ